MSKSNPVENKGFKPSAPPPSPKPQKEIVKHSYQPSSPPPKPNTPPKNK